MHPQADPRAAASGMALPSGDDPAGFHRYTVPTEPPSASAADFNPLMPGYSQQDDAHMRTHMQYYFDVVRPAQFPFASKTLDDTLDAVRQPPS